MYQTGKITNKGTTIMPTCLALGIFGERGFAESAININERSSKNWRVLSEKVSQNNGKLLPKGLCWD